MSQSASASGVLSDAVRRLTARLVALGLALETAQDGQHALWGAYIETAEALARLTASVAPRPEPELLSTKALAQRLGVSPRTVRRHRQAGRLRPAVELGKHTIRWRHPAGGAS